MSVGLQMVRTVVLPAARPLVSRVVVIISDSPSNFNFEPMVSLLGCESSLIACSLPCLCLDCLVLDLLLPSQGGELGMLFFCLAHILTQTYEFQFWLSVYSSPQAEAALIKATGASIFVVCGGTRGCYLPEMLQVASAPTEKVLCYCCLPSTHPRGPPMLPRLTTLALYVYPL